MIKLEMNIKRMNELIDELNGANIEYYTNDNPTMSDKEYDEKYDELVALERKTDIVIDNSPSQRIGDITLKGFTKYTHQAPLWSLDKAQTDEELEEWYNRTEKFVKDYNATHPVKLPKPKYILTKKYDGLTVNCTYDETGYLIKSATRGNGLVGETVDEQAKTIVNLPHKIDNDFEFEIHGEALMNKRAFADYNNSLEKGEKPLKNLRNGSAGALRNLNVKETARRKLIAYMYDIGFSNGFQFDTYVGMLEFIKEKGFPTAEYTVCCTLDEINAQIDVMNTERPTLQHDVDGVVIVVDDMQTRELMGYTVKFPRWGIAKKFLAEETTTTLLDVEWNVGRTGKICPTGILEPVELMGVTVKRATLNNMDDIKRKGVRIGCDVFVRRSGDVIPEIMGTVEGSLEGTTEIEMLKVCPSCGGDIIQDGVHYFCTNSLACKPQLFKAIVHYCQRDAMNIEGFSEKGAELFLEKGIIDNMLDLYSLENKKEEIIKLPKFGLKKYNNLIESVNNSKQCSLSAFLLGLGIEGVGKSTTKELVKFAEGATSRDKLKTIGDLSYNDLLKMKDCGDTTATTIVQWFHNDNNLAMLEDLLKHIEFKEEVKKEVKQGVFTGKTLYCTGTFALGKKPEQTKLVEDNGGTFASGYSKTLDFLVVGSIKGSGKQAKAESENPPIPVLTEEEFLAMIKK